MRLSSSEGDPGYLPWLEWLGNKGGPKVLLNGIEQPMAEVADEELGLIVKAELNERGHIFVTDHDEIARETLYGDVKIEVR